MADQVIYQTEKSLDGMNGQAPAHLRSEVESKIAELKEAMATEDADRIQRLAQEVQQASMAISQAAYQGEPAPGEPGNGTSTAADDEDIVEGEFESA